MMHFHLKCFFISPSIVIVQMSVSYIKDIWSKSLFLSSKVQFNFHVTIEVMIINFANLKYNKKIPN